MSEAIVKSNSNEAQRLLLRGIAAAQGGHKRVATGLLTRAVQLDPENERAWLWLSGVLENPDQAAFCLNAVLKLNPKSERARQGLRWIDERRQIKAQARQGAVASVEHSFSESAPNREARAQGESWWVNWRRNRREMSQARVLFWFAPLLLMIGALLLNQLFARTVAEQMVVPTALPLTAVAVKAPLALPTPVQQLDAAPASVRESLTAGYLSALNPLREQLRSATATYLTATSGAGGSSLANVAATQSLRATVAAALEQFEAMTPPKLLEQAHIDYIKGLQLELQGYDALLEYYGSYAVEHVNRAALRFQEARTYIDRARVAFDGRSALPGAGAALPPQTIR